MSCRKAAKMHVLYSVFVIYISLQLGTCAPTDDLSNIEALLNNFDKKIVYQLPPPANPFVGRVTELSSIQWFHTDKKYVAITGKRGIGKSELAKKYAQEYLDKNAANVVWIDCSSMTSMMTDFENLHKMVIGPIDPTKSRIATVRSVFNHFKKSKSLIILDGANEDNVFIINLKVVIGASDNLDVIVTSRSEKFNNDAFSSIPLQEFTKSEAVKYIKIALKDLDISTEESKCEKLAEQVEYLPLALKAMTDLIIKEHSEGKKTTIDEIVSRLRGDEIPTTEVVIIQNTDVDQEIEKDILEKIEVETKKIGGQIASGATQAWEKVSDGATYVGSQINYGAKQAGQEISKAASSVKKFFSGFG